ncbi:MAG: radical SAM protein [Oscillospiraceae bacterium]
MSFICMECPRRCGALRDDTSGSGFCGEGTDARIARAAPHFWEEPPVSGERGSGTVFFTGCNLRCVYCQNSTISCGGVGKTVTPEKLRDIYLSLIDKGVHNINLVTASHFSDAVIESLEKPLPVPVVWNSSGYESVETLKRLEGKVQVYLPDMKYSSSTTAAKYSRAPDYPETAKRAILEMFRQRGGYVLDGDGLIKSGVIIRHLVLPGNLENTFGVIDWVSESFLPGGVLFSLMSQYTPAGRAAEFPELNRRLSKEEYAAAMEYMERSGIEDGFFQELSSAKEEYTPDFDLTGCDI